MYLIYLVLLSSASAWMFPDLERYCSESYCHIIGGNRKYSGKIAHRLLEFHIDSCSDLEVLKLMPNLRTLELEYCDSSENFTMNDLDPLRFLSTLQLRRGNLSELQDKHFAKFPKMEVLELGGNSIARLTNESFIGLPKLWLLSLPGNDIEVLPQGVFQTLPELLHLDLSGNKIERLGESIFAGNPKLEMLLLNGNPLTWISPTALGSLGSLRLLDLSNCGPLPDLTLQGAHSLILDNSQLKYLDIQGSVMKLQARDNQLTNIRFADKSLVTELDLHNNSLTTDDIPFILMGMWRLQRLDLSNNLIHKFPGAGSDNTSELFLLPNLMHVNLSANLLQRLHFDSPFPWARLTHLDLSYNRLSPYGLPERAINEAFNLQSLHLQGNGITYFRPTTSKKSYSALKEVAFYDNKYKPEVYKNITKFFRDLKVIVLEKTQQDLPSNDSLKEDCAHFIEKSQTLSPKKEIQVHPVEEIIVKNNEGFWNKWNIFLLGILMTSLTVNAVQIRQRYRLRGRHVIPQETPISSMETMFVRDEEMLN